MTDPLAARIARETVHDIKMAERMVRDARRHDLADDQIAALHEIGALTIYLAAFASIEHLVQTIIRED